MSNAHEAVEAASPRQPGDDANPAGGNGQPRARYWMTLSSLEQVIYGTIVITGVIATASPEKYSAGAVLGLAAGTVVAFFLAHLYAQVLAQAIDDHSPRLALAVAAADNSQGMIESLAIPGLALLCGMSRLISDSLAITLAEWLCVGQMFFWCMIVGMRQRRGWKRTVVIGSVFAALGTAIVLLKTVLH